MAKELVLPFNVEAERSVLGAMLMDGDAASIALGALTDESFSEVEPRNRIVFRACEALHEQGKPIDTTTVTDQLKNMKLLDDAGGTDYLFVLLQSSITASNINHYVSIVKDQAVLRDYLLKMNEIRDRYATEGVDDVGAFLTQACSDLNGIASQRSVGDFQTAADVAAAVQKQLELESKSTNRAVTGVPTGFNRLDKYTHGWQNGDLIVLAARPSIGKTAFAMNLAYNAAIRTKKTVAFFSCEMNSVQIMKRLVSSVSLVNAEKIQIGDLRTDKEKAAVYSALEQMKDVPLRFDDTPNPHIGDIIAKAHKLKSDCKDLCFILIDYLNLITTGLPIESRQQEVSQITRDLKELARQLNVPVMVLCQLNRGVEDNEGNVPKLSNLKESGSIEQDADIVMLMYRKDYYDNVIGKKMDNKFMGRDNFTQTLQNQVDNQKAQGKDTGVSITNIQIAKNRNGRIGKVTLMFTHDVSKFDNPTLEMEQAAAKEDGVPFEPVEE
jgi:replicative DNA helicase